MPNTTQLSPQERLAFILKVRNDPEYFVREVLGITTAYQEQIDFVYSIRDAELAHEAMERAWTDEEREEARKLGPDQVSVNGANGVGKDWCFGEIVVPWWIVAHNDTREAKCIITAPTHRQIGEIVWREVRWSYQNAKIPLGGQMLPVDPKWNIDDQFFALGFSTDKPWNITGFHSPNLLVIVSEAHNYPEDAMTQIQRLHPKVLALSGNPFSEVGTFFDSHHGKRHLYRAHTITAWDSPNVKNRGSRIPGLVSRADIERLRLEWGEDSPYYRATVNAEFTEREDGLLRLTWLRAAQARQAVDLGGDLHAGLDVAGPGKNETVLRIRSEGNVIFRKSWRLSDPLSEIVAAVLPYKNRLKTLNVDEIGIGYNMVPRIIEAFGNISCDAAVVGINVGEGPTDKEHMANLKAQLFWNLREYFEEGSINLGLGAALQEDDALEESQLLSLRYGHNNRGQVQMESKEQQQKRGVESPDRAESFMLCFAYYHGGSSALAIDQFEGALRQATQTLTDPIDGLTLTVTERDVIEDEREDSFYSKVF